MRWGMERRLDWIDDRLTAVGRINRSEIVEAFGVTAAVASADISRFRAIDAHLQYDAQRRFYERRGGGTVRGSTSERRTAWHRLSTADPTKPI